MCVSSGEHKPLDMRWQQGVGVLANGHLTFLRRGRLGLRFPRPWLKPVELELLSLKKIDLKLSIWDRFFISSNNDFLAFESSNAQLVMAVPRTSSPSLFGLLET